MKYIFLILFFSGSIAFGQTANSDMIVFTEYRMPKTITSTEVLSLNSIEGSPYLKTAFTAGKIIDTDKNRYQSANLRYHFLRDIIEIDVEGEDNPVVLPKLKNIEYLIGEEKFFYGSLKTEKNEILEGYFTELFADKNLRFISQYKIDYKYPRIGETGYENDKPGKLSFEKIYFVQKNKGSLKEMKINKRSVGAIFKDTRSSEYLNNHKIKSEKDVIDFLKFYTQ
ncbi:hypothetical protein [Christiangramia sediminis]|uniref:Uncharacterized protein n=1 Tax=Christiangramia sediminis TaxID=2881336 RepID=A0A9X1LHL4_9FLAO|nr:hypothetical protein [Christiangramia sediminis]MCB7480512.1 hypothetical protein [Christiangramia sediminis]